MKRLFLLINLMAYLMALDIALADSSNRLKKFEKHQRETLEFNEERESGLSFYLNRKKKFELERERNRENFLKKYKAPLIYVEDESKPGFKEFSEVKKKKKKEFIKAQENFIKEQAFLKGKKANYDAVETIEYGLQDTEKNRIDPIHRKIYGHTTAAGLSSGFGGGKTSKESSFGGGSSGGGGASPPNYMPPPIPREEMDEFDEIEPPPPPPMPMEGLDEGGILPQPPPSGGDFNF
jgi:uncharacterized membrane protein YgcG